jgi:hypothetical protein
VSGDPRKQPFRSAPPVAEVPVDALLARADELAKRWAVALLFALPLERIGEIPLEDLASEAPSVCAQAIRALQSDEELERMAGPAATAGGGEFTPAQKLGTLAGARDAGAVVEAVEALRGVLWEALLGELRLPSPAAPIFASSPARQVADLADRLARVCATALAASLGEAPARSVRHRMAPAAREQVVYGSDRALVGRRHAVLVDEREDGVHPPRASGQRPRGRKGSLGHAAARAGPGGAPAAGAHERQPTPEPQLASERPRPSEPPPSFRAQRTSQEQRTSQASERQPRQARPLPWDIPLSDDRPERAPLKAAAEDAGAVRGVPVMRITRRSTPPADESA